jgi:transcriptional regulator with XRE-family HTH domain
VAEQIGVTKCTIQYWETNRVLPALRFRPRIVSFLGYDAFGGISPDSLAERLKAHRERLGLSRKKLAALLGIDPSTVAGWETEKHRPSNKFLKIVDDLLNGRVGPIADFQESNMRASLRI